MLLSDSEKENYRRLIARLAKEILRLAARHGDALQCHPGCSSCCSAFSVFPLEAALLREAVSAIPEELKAVMLRRSAEEKAAAACPFLVNDLCVVYEARPVICRSHGLPLAYIDEEQGIIEVSACPLNFGQEATFTEEDLLFLDEFNAELAELNAAYCRARGLPPHVRIPISLI
jgi:Fe-S-cluster containining protein